MHTSLGVFMYSFAPTYLALSRYIYICIYTHTYTYTYILSGGEVWRRVSCFCLLFRISIWKAFEIYWQGEGETTEALEVRQNVMKISIPPNAELLSESPLTPTYLTSLTSSPFPPILSSLVVHFPPTLDWTSTHLPTYLLIYLLISNIRSLFMEAGFSD